MKIQVLLSIDKDVKETFKSEVSKNGTDMSTTTELLMKRYISMSITKRKARYEALAILKAKKDDQ